MSPADIEIRWIPRDDIYDLFVNGRFKNFYRTFGEAALAAEKAVDMDVFQQWKKQSPKKGKVRV